MDRARALTRYQNMWSSCPSAIVELRVDAIPATNGGSSHVFRFDSCYVSSPSPPLSTPAQATTTARSPTPGSWFRKITDCGHASDDDAQLRRQKSVFTGASFLKAGMCPMWCAMFVSVGGFVAGGENALVTGLNVITGTPAYLSPEAIAKPDAVDGRSDLYALGCVAFTLLTGRPPFEGASVVEVCGEHLHAAPPSPSAVRGEPIAPELEALVLACLAKKPSDRPATAEELAERLARCGVAPWTQALAAAWWVDHGDLTYDENAATVSTELSIDLAVRERATA